MFREFTVATSRWFDQKHPSFGTQAMLPLTELLDLNGGFLVNGEVKIVAEVGVLCWQIRCVSGNSIGK